MKSGTVVAILPCNDLDASERFYAVTLVAIAAIAIIVFW
jgi:hypothetical protein